MHRHEAEGVVILRQMRTLPTKPAVDDPSLPLVAIVDVETMGLAPSDPVIEFGIAVYQLAPDGALRGPVYEASEFADPGRPVPAEITALTGIDDDDVRGQRIAWRQHAEQMSECSALWAHNAAFDAPRVEAAMRAAGVAPPNAPWGCTMAGIDWKAKHRAWAVGLQVLCAQVAGFYLAEGGHRAAEDCQAVAHLLTLTGEAPELLRRTLAADLVVDGCPSFDRSGRTQTQLKARGFRWDADGRRWWKLANSRDEARELLNWSSLTHRPGLFRVTERPAAERFRGVGGGR